MSTPAAAPTPATEPSTAAADAPQEVWISLYEARRKIYPRSVNGIFAQWRWVIVWATQLLYYGLPWLSWGERQAVLFDLEVRRFYLFGLVLYPQDFIFLTWLLVICALSLFLFTAVAGRLWCGYACPQTVYSEIFMWVERRFEGDRSARMRLDQGPWTLAKFGRKGGKHLVWVLLALWTGFTLVGYFTPIRQLADAVAQWRTGPWETFWILFYGLATWGNAGFLREQVCKYMCPYARFQSAMFDKDTLIVTYDAGRGEPRGARSRKADFKALGLGECVDCSLCVQVCPTGIDIRKGLQYECIGCGACADVCDTVMDKVGYPRGLVRYSTQNAVANRWSRSQIWQRVRRPRILVYTSLLAALTVGLLIALALRTPLKVDVVRDRAALARIVSGGKIENLYRLQIMNATEREQRYQVSLRGLPGLELVEATEPFVVGPAQARWITLHAHLPADQGKPGSHPVEFYIEAVGAADHVAEKSVFLVPR